MTPAAPTDYPTSPPAESPRLGRRGRRPPDAGAGPVSHAYAPPAPRGTPVLALAAYGAAADVCPGSDAWVHASCENTVVFTSTSCADVMTEMKARISGTAQRPAAATIFEGF